MIHLLLRTKKFIPNEFQKTFFDIDFEGLYKKGYKLILTDLDNTLISYEEYKPNQVILDKLESLKNIGYETVLVSNNIPERINSFVEGTDIIGFGNARKPLLIGMKKAIRSVDTKVELSEIIFVGDQLMTDIYGANRLGVYSILVNPIKRKTEKWYTKINRKMEAKMLQKIRKKHTKIYSELGLTERR